MWCGFPNPPCLLPGLKTQATFLTIFNVNPDMKYTSFYLYAALAILLFSCRADELSRADIVSGEAEFAIPLGKATTNIEDLLKNFDDFTFIEITPDNVIHVKYRGDVLSQQADEFLSVTRDSVPPIIPLIDTNFIVVPFSSPDVLEVDKAIYKTGVVGIAVSSSSYTGPVKLTVRLPQVSNNGVPLTWETTFDSPLTGPLGAVQLPGMSTDVSGFTLIPENGVITIDYDAVTDNGAGDTITLDVVALVNTNIYFSYFEGYLGDVKHRGERDTINIDFFDSWTQGDVFFEDPKITIYIENSFGVPTRSVIGVFDILTADGQRIPLESEFIDTVGGIDFDYPTVPGDVANMVFDFTSDNSNIVQVLGSRPIALDYQVDARMNPDTLVSLRGFVTDSSYYNIQVEVDLPLFGRASGFGVMDEFQIDFNGYDEILEAEFKLVADNDIPLNIDGQAYFVDSSGVILDSLFDSGPVRIVSSAPVDVEGNVIARTTQTTFATFSAERFENVRKAVKISLEVFFSTFNDGQQSVKALKGQETEIRMGLKLLRE